MASDASNKAAKSALRHKPLKQVLTLYLQDLIEGTNLSSAGCVDSSFSPLFPSAGVPVMLDR
jgi:hypothetical protein